MAASDRHSDSDGSDIFWPGYVDAVTNLVLNLLFLLTIMTVAVFMFALELGRSSKGGPSEPSTAAGKQGAAVVEAATTDPLKENAALKREIQRLTMELAQRDDQKLQAASAGHLAQAVDVTANAPKPRTGLEKAVASSFEVIVRFQDDAVAFTPEEHTRLLEALKPVVANGKADVQVEVPAGFSEAKRMGFYRVMAVRNLLIEMDLPQKNISVAVVEGKSNANASLVKVK